MSALDLCCQEFNRHYVCSTGLSTYTKVLSDTNAKYDVQSKVHLIAKCIYMNPTMSIGMAKIYENYIIVSLEAS